MFEVLLTQDYEDIFFFREFEINGVSEKSSILSPSRQSPRRSGTNSRSRSPNKGTIVLSPDGTKAIF
jgi:hypothetical protein